MTRTSAGLLALTVTLVISGRASAGLISTWTAPNAQPIQPEPGSKVIAVVQQKAEASRRYHEDALAAELTRRGYEGVPSYELVPVEQLNDEGAAKAAFEQSGAVGVVVMRAIGEVLDITERPSTYLAPNYGAFWGGYYAYGWTMISEPSYLSMETKVMIETLVYDLQQNTLLWAGTSQSADLSNTRQLIQQIVSAAADEMAEAGIIVR